MEKLFIYSVRFGLFLLWSIYSAGVSATCQHVDDEKSVILVVGDSLSSAYGMDPAVGWVSLLQQKLNTVSDSFEVFNASVSGDTTAGGVTRLSKVLREKKPQLVVIELGGNDGLRALPLGVLKNNLSTMIEAAQQANAQPVLLGMRIPSNYGPRYSEKFHQTYHELAAEYDVPLTAFFLEQVALDDSLMQADGIHPNEQAQVRMLDTAWPAIAEGLERQCGSALK